MANVSYKGETFSCVTALKGEDYVHLLDNEGKMVVAFDGVTDFSLFTITDGTWTTPTSAHDCYVATIGDDGTIKKGGHRCCDLNKAENTSIPSTTAAALGLSGDPTVDDALGVLSKKADERVGDICLTVRTDMEDDWLLCNGEAISADEYPELYAIAQGLGLDGICDVWSYGSNNVRIYSIAYANGYWVVGGKRIINLSTAPACIAYATDIMGPWTIVDVFGSDYGGEINSVTYANGYWVVGGQYKNTNTYFARIAYTTDLTGTWTTKDLWSTASTSGDVTKINCITYANGYWVAAGARYDGNTYARIAYATSPAGTWTTKDLWSDDTSYNIVNAVTYANGYWVVGGQYRIDNSTYCARIAYTTSLSGTWTTKDLWSDDSYTGIKSLAYADGIFVVGGGYYSNNIDHARVAYAGDIANTWTIKDLWSGSVSNKNSNIIRCLAYAEGIWGVGGGYYANSTFYARVGSLNKVVPTISVSEAYAYIKAKEG